MSNSKNSWLRRGHSKQNHQAEPPPPASQQTPLNQAVGGAKDMASRAQRYYQNTVSPAFEKSGAKEFYNSKVAPNAKNATQFVAHTVTDQHSKLISTPISRTAIVLLIVSVLATISTFLPMGPSPLGRYFSAAQNATEGNFDGVGSLLLLQVLGGLTSIVAATVLRILLVMTIVASIFAVALRKRLAKRIASAFGMTAGLVGVLAGLLTLFVMGNVDNAPRSIGTFILLACSVSVTISAIFLLKFSRPPAVQEPPVYRSPYRT